METTQRRCASFCSDLVVDILHGCFLTENSDVAEHFAVSWHARTPGSSMLISVALLWHGCNIAAVKMWCMRHLVSSFPMGCLNREQAAGFI